MLFKNFYNEGDCLINSSKLLSCKSGNTSFARNPWYKDQSIVTHSIRVQVIILLAAFLPLATSLSCIAIPDVYIWAVAIH